MKRAIILHSVATRGSLRHALTGWAFVLLGLCVILLIGGCATPDSRFLEAKQRDNVYAYKAFVDQYPNHPLATQARIRMDELEFQKAAKENS